MERNSTQLDRKDGNSFEERIEVERRGAVGNGTEQNELEKDGMIVERKETELNTTEHNKME